jgi:hypothetical protein
MVRRKKVGWVVRPKAVECAIFCYLVKVHCSDILKNEKNLLYFQKKNIILKKTTTINLE